MGFASETASEENIIEGACHRNRSRKNHADYVDTNFAKWLKALGRGREENCAQDFENLSGLVFYLGGMIRKPVIGTASASSFLTDLLPIGPLRRERGKNTGISGSIRLMDSVGSVTPTHQSSVPKKNVNSRETDFTIFVTLSGVSSIEAITLSLSFVMSGLWLCRTSLALRVPAIS